MVSEGSSCFTLLFSGSCLPSFNSLIFCLSMFSSHSPISLLFLYVSAPPLCLYQP